MLTQSNEYGYASIAGGYAQQAHQQQAQTHSGERPKLFSLDSALLQQHNAYAMPGYPHQIMHHQTTPHAMTPQQQHQQGAYDHEPLMMGIQGANQYYQPMANQMLQISTDYHQHQQHAHAAATPASSTNSGGNAGSKRSREELNMKEKKRMFKLNDRINHLKVVLEEAGVQTKKNKQSVLDNTFHYIGMLRSNLLIAKQKAERAEKQAEAFRSQVQQMANSNGAAELMFKRCFQQSSTPRVIVDPAFNIVAVNPAFLAHSGQTEQSLAEGDNVCASLCMDDAKLRSIVSSANSNTRPSGVIVQARSASGVVTATLMASAITDEVTDSTTIEFSLVPFEISSSEQLPSVASSGHGNMTTITPQSSGFVGKAEISEASPSGVSDLGV